MIHARPVFAERFQLVAGLILHPAAFFCVLVFLLYGLGRLQQLGWLVTEPVEVSETAGETVTYICPMMCVEPTNAPGRCPVCAMELVPATSGAAGDGMSVQIDRETRRLLNIATATVVRRPLELSVQAVGEIGYDETRLRTLSAYVDGRIEELYAGYTGVVVAQGQPLARIYSPRLYASQVELLSAKQLQRTRPGLQTPATADPPTAINSGILAVGGSGMYDSAYRRLIELGMTGPQIEQLETSGQADSRLQLVAPISGTVIEKLVVEGQYVKEGDRIYRLADLSQVWLMLKLFPEDAALLEVGHTVTAKIQSQPNQPIAGTVEFLSPQVDPETRTVSVRVVMANPMGLLRIGDLARATIQVGPRTDLPPGADGDSTLTDGAPLWIPRDAVLRVGQSSVAYVETEPGRFEIRWLKTGPVIGTDMVIWEGLELGESVATRANFLLDSQMQLTQQPSLINPAKAIPRSLEDFEWTEEMLAAIAPLSEEEREIVRQQKLCPVGQQPLGSMGTPLRVDVNDQIIFICCEGCRSPLVNEPDQYLPKMARPQELEQSR